MRFLTSLAMISAVLAGIVSANGLISVNGFVKRQGGDAFIPGQTPTDSCNNGWVDCGPTECILPSRGDVCCSEGYGCPGGSFCLTQGYCCPNGEDPATCALNNGVSLSAGFNTAPGPTGSPATSTTASSTPADPLRVIAAYTGPVASYSAGYNYSSPTMAPQQFLGSASHSMEAFGGLAVAAGVLAYFM